MKKIFLIAFLISLCFYSCDTPGVSNPGVNEGEVFLRVGSKVLKVHKVTLSSSGERIWVLAPKDTTVEVYIETIGIKNGKSSSSVITVE